ncbi:MAG: hypothetical protein N4A50_11365 [Vallitalea sp.]|jgi:hypothetical protein|nr:hypothetical protein [Vallitalea sp.]
MKEDIFNEEDFKMEISNINIQVPEEFNNRVENRINTLKTRNRIKKLIIASITFIILIISSLKLSPEVASYALEIPGLDMLVKFLNKDIGINNAVENGYKKLGPFEKIENYYKFIVDNMVIDEDRIAFDLIIYYKNQQAIKMMADGNYVQVRFNNIEIISSANPYKENVMHFEACIGNNKLKELIESDGFLSFDIILCKENNYIDNKVNRNKIVARDFNIKLNKEDIKFSKIYKCNKSIETPYGVINIKQFTVYPTRMSIDIECDFQDGYFFSFFEDIYIEDSEMNKYIQEGTISYYNSYKFMPSMYFERIPNYIYVCINGIRIGADEGLEFIVSQKEEYPKTIYYMGQQIVIEEIEYREEQDTLFVVIKKPNENMLKFSLSIDKQSSIGYSELENNRMRYFFSNIDNREQYSIKLVNVGYYVPLDTRLKIELDNMKD